MVYEPVPEGRFRPHRNPPFGEQAPGGVEPDASERDDDADSRQRGDFRHQMRMTGDDFLRQWFVVGRSAPHGRGDVGIVQPQSVGGVL